MKASSKYLSSFYTILIYLYLSIFLTSCDTHKNSVPSPAPESIADSDNITIIEPQVSFSVEAPSDEIATEKKDLKVVLSVDSVMYLGQSGMMEVWIGEEDIDLTFSKGMVQDEKSIASTVGRFAKIIPYAPDFEVKALSATLCYKIDPSGSEVRYSLTPKDEGKYKVSADIELYETEDCTGISVPKTARALSVSVGVDMNKEVSKRIHKMEEVAADKFMIFWIALVTLLFGAAIFVIRRYIKNKTGYEESSGNS